MKFFVVENLPTSLPNYNIQPRDTEAFGNQALELADPKWFVPRPVNLLISVVECSKFKHGQLMKYGETCYEDTALGIVVRGGAECLVDEAISSFNTTHEEMHTAQEDKRVAIEQIQINLDKFFDYSESRAEPEDIDEAEKQFREKHYIKNDGTYVVPFPWKKPIGLGESRSMCIARNKRAIARLSDDVRKETYNVMRSYIDKKIWVKSNKGVTGHYNPITIVHKPESLTTPVRICVDASAKTTNGKSLNDNMLTGTKLQPDIDDQIQKLRISKIGIAADVKAMYLNAEMLPEDQKYQRTIVFWENGQVAEYDMTTIVFGTRAAPFLANRVFKDIAQKYKDSHPLGSK